MIDFNEFLNFKLHTFLLFLFVCRAIFYNHELEKIGSYGKDVLKFPNGTIEIFAEIYHKHFYFNFRNLTINTYIKDKMVYFF